MNSCVPAFSCNNVGTAVCGYLDPCVCLRVCCRGQTSTTQLLSLPQFVFFAVTVVIGSNGEQLLDGVINLDMDAAVAGGRVTAAAAKEAVTAVCNAAAFSIFFVANYRARFGGTRQSRLG